MANCTGSGRIPAQAGASTHYACASGILPYLVQIQWSPVYLQWRRSGFFQILIHPFSGKESKWMCAGCKSNLIAGGPILKTIALERLSPFCRGHRRLLCNSLPSRWAVVDRSLLRLLRSYRDYVQP